MTLANRSALLLRPGALGDAVLTLPVLHALQRSGIRRITVLGNPASWAFLSHAEAANQLRIWDGGTADWLGLYAPGASLSSTARELLAETDIAVAYLREHGPEKSGIAQALQRAGVKEVLTVDPPTHPPHSSQALPSSTPDFIESCHAARRLLDPVMVRWGGQAEPSPILTQPLPKDPFLALIPDEVSAALSRLGLKEPPDRGLLAFHPGSGGQAKRWPAASFIQLAREAARRHGLVPLAFFGPADDSARKEIEGQWPKDLELFRAVHFPLREVLALLSVSRLYVGNDSGITHLAARCVPTVALFGPTDPRVWRPLGREVTVLQSPSASMADLPVESVLMNVLKGPP